MQVARRAEAPGGRRVRRGVDRRDGRLGVQRVQQHQACAVGTRPGQLGAQVGVVAHRPGRRAAQAVELDHPAPGPVGDRCQAGGGDREHAGRRAVTGPGDQPVPAQRQTRQGGLPPDPTVATGHDRGGHGDLADRAVLELDRQADGLALHAVQRHAAHDAQDDRRREQPQPGSALGSGQRPFGIGAVDAHRGERRDDRGVGDGGGPPGVVDVGGGDPVDGREPVEGGRHRRPVPGGEAVMHRCAGGRS